MFFPKRLSNLDATIAVIVCRDRRQHPLGQKSVNALARLATTKLPQV